MRSHGHSAWSLRSSPAARWGWVRRTSSCPGRDRRQHDRLALTRNATVFVSGTTHCSQCCGCVVLGDRHGDPRCGPVGWCALEGRVAAGGPAGCRVTASVGQGLARQRFAALRDRRHATGTNDRPLAIAKQAAAIAARVESVLVMRVLRVATGISRATPGRRWRQRQVP
jgi:hypothetical protein